MKRSTIQLTKHEIMSGSDRQSHAEGLIQQLPADHDGRNIWLVNYGVSSEAMSKRRKHGIVFNAAYMAAEGANYRHQPLPPKRKPHFLVTLMATGAILSGFTLLAFVVYSAVEDDMIEVKHNHQCEYVLNKSEFQ